jgi:hypothetical protein
MQILRLPPYPLTISYDVPLANTEYLLLIQDSSRNVIEVEENINSTSGSALHNAAKCAKSATGSRFA